MRFRAAGKLSLAVLMTADMVFEFAESRRGSASCNRAIDDGSIPEAEFFCKECLSFHARVLLKKPGVVVGFASFGHQD